MSEPGKTLALNAVIAPNAVAAAQYYPPNYWLSMLNIPPKERLPYEAPRVPAKKRSPLRAIGFDAVKKVARLATRWATKSPARCRGILARFPPRRKLGSGASYRAKSAGNASQLSRFGLRPRHCHVRRLDPAHHSAEKFRPPRRGRQGMERNIVLTIWDIRRPKTLFSIPRFPRYRWNPQRESRTARSITAIGPEATLVRVDPQENSASTIKIPLPQRSRQENPCPLGRPSTLTAPSPYWGNEDRMGRSV